MNLSFLIPSRRNIRGNGAFLGNLGTGNRFFRKISLRNRGFVQNRGGFFRRFGRH